MTYAELVEQRKTFKLEINGLINQSALAFDDGDYLDPWAKWHNSPTATVMVIGQDWGNVRYYEDNLGLDDANNPTCKNLKELFNVLEIDTGTPTKSTNDSRLHFANIIPFLRTGKMQGNLPLILNQEKINEFAHIFIDPLIKLIKPKVIVTLGLSAYHGVLSINNETDIKSRTLKSLVVEDNPIKLGNGALLFPMYHCGASVINRNRGLDRQKQDWLKIKTYL